MNKFNKSETVTLEIPLFTLRLLDRAIVSPLVEASIKEEANEKKPATKAYFHLTGLSDNELAKFLLETAVRQVIAAHAQNIIDKRFNSNIVKRVYYKVKWGACRFYQRLRRISPKVRAEDREFEEFLESLKK